MLATEKSIAHLDGALSNPCQRDMMPQFDPKIHLNFIHTKARYSFTGLGLEQPYKAPDTCYTEPFQLFSEECVRLMRRELFRKEFLDKYMRTWERAPCYVGGFSAEDGAYLPQEASFIKQAWYHPATQAAIDEAFGTAPQPLRRHCDVGYANVQLGVEGLEDESGIAGSSWDQLPIDAWHKDQVPVVFVVMLSDTSSMEGGETAVRLAIGSMIKARGASLGGAVIMQGGNIEHAAMRASNCSERVSMVTSYAFANPDLDDSRTTLKGADYLNEDMASLRFAHLDHKITKLWICLNKFT